MNTDNYLIRKQRFKRLAESRTNEIIKKIKVLLKFNQQSTYYFIFFKILKMENQHRLKK